MSASMNFALAFPLAVIVLVALLLTIFATAILVKHCCNSWSKRLRRDNGIVPARYRSLLKMPAYSGTLGESHDKDALLSLGTNDQSQGMTRSHSFNPVIPNKTIRFETPPLRDGISHRAVQPKLAPKHYVTVGGRGLSKQQSTTSSLHETMAAEEAMPSHDEIKSSAFGWLHFSMFYDHANRVLEIKVLKAKNLAAKDMSGTSDPYVQLRLVPDKETLRTASKRKTLNPVWNEAFQFKGYSADKLKARSLQLKVFDMDRFSRDDPIGEIVFPMRNFNFDDVYTFWKELQPCISTKSKGQIEIGLMYNPDNNSMTVHIIQCHDLPAKDVSMTSDPYVKIWYLLKGVKINKQKTEVKRKCLNPRFDESFSFPIEPGRLKDTTLLVSVMDYDKMSSNDKIGGILLGTRSGISESLHWKEAFNRSRTEIKYWHELKGLEKLQSYFSKRS